MLAGRPHRSFAVRETDLHHHFTRLVIIHERFDAILLAMHPSDEAQGHVDRLVTRQVHLQ